MTPEKQGERVILLTKIGQEVETYLLKQHVASGGDKREIAFNSEKIPNLVSDYSELLEAYRDRHGIDDLVDGDKIAAFTGVLIMRHWTIESLTGEVNTIHAALANETFAIRASELFVRKRSFPIRPDLHKQIMLCFSNCHDHDDCLNTWTVATMTHHLKEGTIKDTIYAD